MINLQKTMLGAMLGALMSLSVTSCTLFSQSRVRSSETLPATAFNGFEKILEKNNISNVAGFLASQKAQDDYYNYTVQYYGDNHLQGRECFNAIVDNIKKLTEARADSSPEEAAMTAQVAKRLWEAPPGNAFILPAKVVNYGVSVSNTAELQKIRMRYYSLWLEQIHVYEQANKSNTAAADSLTFESKTAQINLSFQDKGKLKEGIAKMQQALQADISAAQQSNKDVTEEIRKNPKARAIIAAAALFNYFGHAMSLGGAGTGDQNTGVLTVPNVFLNAWRLMHDAMGETLDSLGVAFPGMGQIAAELVPNVKTLVAQNPSFINGSGLPIEKFEEGLWRSDAQIVVTPPSRRLHAMFMQNGGYYCSRSTAYEYGIALFDGAYSFVLEQGGSFRGSALLLPLVYKYRFENQDKFDGRYVVYSPSFAGSVFGELLTTDLTSAEKSEAYALNLFNTFFTEQMPANAIGIGMAYSSFQDSYATSVFNNNLGGYSQPPIGDRPDLMLTSEGRETMMHFVKRIDPAQEQHRNRMVPDLTMLSPLILSEATVFKQLNYFPLEKAIMQRKLAPAGASTLAAGCPIQVSQLSLLELKKAFEINLLLNCILENNDFKAGMRGEFRAPTSDFSALLNVASNLSKRVLGFSPEAAAAIQENTGFLSAFATFVESFKKQNTPDASGSNNNSAPSFYSYNGDTYYSFIANLGIITGYALSPTESVALLESILEISDLCKKASTSEETVKAICHFKKNQLAEDTKTQRIKAMVTEMLSKNRN